MKEPGALRLACRAWLPGLILVLLVSAEAIAQQSGPSEPEIEALRVEKIRNTSDLEARLRQAESTGENALASVREARARGRALLESVADQPGREEAVAEAHAVLAGALELLDQSAREAKAAATKARGALGELETASSREALDEAERQARAAAEQAVEAAKEAARTAALALQAQAEITRRAAGADPTVYPDPGWRRIKPFGIVVGSILALLVVGYLFNQFRQWRRRKSGAPFARGEDADLRDTVFQIQWWFLVVLLAGVALQFFWLMAGGLGPPGASPEVAFVLHLGTSGAALVLGGVLGFLFGIPRTPDPATIAVDAGDPTWRTRVATNTSLEQVSTWLTTLLLGATLVELGSIMGGLWRVAGLLSGAPDDPAEVTPGRIFTLSLMIFYFGAGFLGFYLLTRLYLTYALALTIRQGRFGGGAEALQDINAEIHEALKQGDALNPVYLRGLLERAAQIEGAMHRPDHLVLRLRSWGRLYGKAQHLKEDRTTIVQNAVRDLQALERVSHAWSGDREKAKELVTDLMTSDDATREDLQAFNDEPLFQQYGVPKPATDQPPTKPPDKLAQAKAVLRKALDNGGLTVADLDKALVGLTGKDQRDPELAELTVRALCRWARLKKPPIDEMERTRQLAKAKEALGRVAHTGPLLDDPDVKPFADRLTHTGPAKL